MLPSVRLKVSLGVFLALIVLLVPFSWLQYQLHRLAEMAELGKLASTAGAVARRGLEEGMLPHDRDAVQAVIDDLALLTGADSVYLLTTGSVVAASPFSRENGLIVDSLSVSCYGCHRLPAEDRPTTIVATDAAGLAVFRTITPIENAPACQECHPADNRLAGIFYMELPMLNLNAHLQRDLRIVLLGSGALTAFAALVIYGLVSRLIINPLDWVVEAMRKFSRGDHSARSAVHSQDETGLLAGVFNQMADTIETQDEQAEQLLADVQSANCMRRQLLTRLTTAREEERQHLSREIHDKLGQLLTGLSLQLKLSERAIPPGGDVARAHLARASALVRDTIDQSHQLVVDLRPTVLDDYGLVPALQEELERRLAARGIATHLDLAGNLECLPSDVATTAFRIIQEAITNVIRHAEAQEVWVSVKLAGGLLAASVEDNGVGLPEQALANGKSLGILGMRERAQGMGGSLDVGRREPRGTRVTFQLPLYGGV